MHTCHNPEFLRGSCPLYVSVAVATSWTAALGSVAPFSRTQDSISACSARPDCGRRLGPFTDRAKLFFLLCDLHVLAVVPTVSPATPHARQLKRHRAGEGRMVTSRRGWRNRNGGVKTAAWRTFRRRSTLHYAVKSKRVTVQGPVKKPPMDYMSHRGGGVPLGEGGAGN